MTSQGALQFERARVQVRMQLNAPERYAPGNHELTVRSGSFSILELQTGRIQRAPRNPGYGTEQE